MINNKANRLSATYNNHLETISGVKFTPREIDVIACLLGGRTTKVICQFLSIEEKTVETHKYNIMRKLDGNSKESIIDFVEKSDKFPSVKKHYLDLLSQHLFAKGTQEILALTGKGGAVCSLVYWRGHEQKAPFVNQLEKHLKLAGLKVSLEVRENYRSLNHLIHHIESQTLDYVIYIVPPALLEQLQADNIKGKLETFPFIQRSFKNPGSVVFVLGTRDARTELPSAIQDAGYVDCEEQGNYYFSVFEILRKVMPDKNLDKTIAGFKRQYETIHNSSEKLPTKKEIEGKTNSTSTEESLYKAFLLHLSKKGRWRLFSGSMFFVSIACFLFYNNNNKLAKNAPSAQSQELLTIRPDLPIPAHNTLLKRPKILAQMEEKLKGQEGIQTIVLTGIGGSGKTTLAREYTHDKNPSVIWEINAETKGSLVASFESLAYALSQTEEEKKMLKGLQDIKNPMEREEKIIISMKEKLKSYPGWILIFDNVEKFADIQKYFPCDPLVWGGGKIIVTTRNSNIESHSSLHYSIPIRELTPEEKLTLFTSILGNGQAQEITAAQKGKTLAFLNELPSFPLDISIAAYYLKTTNTSYDEYINNINEYDNGFDSVQSDILNEVGGYSKTRYKIIALSLKEIMKGSKDFGKLLLFISLIDSQDIPKDLLNQYNNSVVVDNFIYHLKKYSLTTNDLSSLSSSVSSLSIHRSMQSIILSYLVKELKLEKGHALIQEISNTLDGYIDKMIEEEDFAKIKKLSSHIERFLNHPSDLLTGFFRGLLGSKLGCVFYYLNEGIRSQKIIEESLDILSSKNLNQYSDKDKDKIANSFLHIGNVYTELGNYQEAQRLFEQSLNIYNQSSPRDELGAAWALSHLGNAYRRLGYYEKAKDFLEESREIQKEYRSKNYGRIARTLGYLGNIYKWLGDYTKSIKMLEESLKHYQDHFSENHFRIGWVYSHLGNLHRKAGNFETSRILFEKGLKIYKINFSEDHVNVGLMLAYLGNTHRVLKDYEKAKFFLEKGLNIHEKQFQKNHERIAWISLHLANVYMSLKNYKKSKELFDKALIFYKSVNKKGDIEKSEIFRNIGEIYLFETQLEDADYFLKQSLKILKNKPHPNASSALECLANLCEKKYTRAKNERNGEQAQALKDQAINYLNQAIQISKPYFSNYSSHLQRMQSKMAELQKME